MKQILITGATGNIGVEVVRFLNQLNTDHEIIVAARNLEKAKTIFAHQAGLSYRPFDFENFDSFPSAFNGIDVLFLLRPPHISKVEVFFRPLLASAKANGIEQVVFLSVQGVEKSKVIPHHKIEQLIKTLGFHFIFVRPSYFMQNLTTTLRQEIVAQRTITLPAGKAKFNWVDVENIGEAAARLLIEFEKFQDNAYEITGTENKNFLEVVAIISEITEDKIVYRNINPFCFYFKKRKAGMSSGFAIVMTILHFLPRFQKEPKISINYQKLTGKEPTSLRAFIEREKDIMKP